MKLEPYKYIADLSLEIEVPNLIHMMGDPLSRETNTVGLMEFDYGSKIYRFDQSGKLNELTIDCRAIEFQAVTIPFTQLKGFVIAQDSTAFDKYGFCVSPLLGVAFDPEYQSWLTVLTETGIRAWSKI